MFTYLSIKNIYNRLKATPPTFFKKLRIWMVALGGLGGILIAAKSASSPYLDYIPNELISILITCGTLGTFLTSLPVDTTNNTNIK